MTPSAAARFFGIPELLEMALSYLPTLQLLLFQRVNKYAQRCIETATFFQRQLYFLADSHGDDSYEQVKENPFLLKIDKPFETRISDGTCTEHISIRELLVDSHPTASWKRMLVVTLPVTKILVGGYIQGSFIFEVTGILCKIENANGCKMGEVVDSLRKVQDRADHVRLWIYYNESFIRDVYPMSS